jgi:hypothetical protein
LKYVAELIPASLSAEADPLEQPDVARVLKDAADNTTKLARITGSEDDLKQAASFAAAAILFSPSGKLKAFSWAALGAASHEAGDFAVAVPAYRAAVEQGAKAPWVFKDLRGAEVALGRRPETGLSLQYLKDQARTVTEVRR